MGWWWCCCLGVFFVFCVFLNNYFSVWVGVVGGFGCGYCGGFGGVIVDLLGWCYPVLISFGVVVCGMGG